MYVTHKDIFYSLSYISHFQKRIFLHEKITRHKEFFSSRWCNRPFFGCYIEASILSFENAVAKPVEIGNYDPRVSLAPLNQKVESYCCKY